VSDNGNEHLDKFGVVFLVFWNLQLPDLPETLEGFVLEVDGGEELDAERLNEFGLKDKTHGDPTKEALQRLERCD
jgi:hypothetical protein